MDFASLSMLRGKRQKTLLIVSTSRSLMGDRYASIGILASSLAVNLVVAVEAVRFVMRLIRTTLIRTALQLCAQTFSMKFHFNNYRRGGPSRGGYQGGSGRGGFRSGGYKRSRDEGGDEMDYED